ncbi:hypothetical protein [uncultured Rhodoblastus sp.]|uniref:hypothetical protein n=1 Tax=uncultured Rhodoblastus sp. TaxID=543037 RepID=UPI0025D3130E|nr:hypothetical protein [uncultured Rhodoblastus sp.]
MPRKLVALTLAGARKSELANAWARLGFAPDRSGEAIALSDGVALAFFAADDAAAAAVGDLQARAFLAYFAGRLSGAAMLTLAGSPQECGAARPEPFGGADCFVILAPPRHKTAPAQPNGVTGLKTLVAVAESPADHAEALTHLTGQHEMLATSAGLEIALEGGTALAVLSPLAFAFRYGFAAPESGAFRIAGLVFRVGDLSATEKFLERKGVEPKIQAGRLIARPGEGAGVAVAFEQD